MTWSRRADPPPKAAAMAPTDTQPGAAAPKSEDGGADIPAWADGGAGGGGGPAGGAEGSAPPMEGPPALQDDVPQDGGVCYYPPPVDANGNYCGPPLDANGNHCGPPVDANGNYYGPPPVDANGYYVDGGDYGGGALYAPAPAYGAVGSGLVGSAGAPQPPPPQMQRLGAPDSSAAPSSREKSGKSLAGAAQSKSKAAPAVAGGKPANVKAMPMPKAKATPSAVAKATPSSAVAKAVSRPAAPMRTTASDDSSSDDDFCGTEYFRRLNFWKVHRMELLKWEEAFKRNALRNVPLLHGSLGEMVTRYLCWRRAVMQAAGVFWMISLCIHAVLLFLNIKESYLGYGSGTVWGVELGEYAEHFRTYIALDYAARTTIIIAGYLAVFFVFCAAYLWRKFTASRPPAFVSYLLGYSTPFIVYLMLSQSTAVDIEAIQQHICRDLLIGAYRDPNWPPGKLLLQASGGSQGVGFTFTAIDEMMNIDLEKSGNLSHAFGIPVETCNSDPDTWDEQVEQLIQQNGRLPGRDGRPCPKALNDHTRNVLEDQGILPSTSKNITDLRTELPGICDRGSCASCKAQQCIKAVPATQRVRVGKGNLQDHQDAASAVGDGACNKCDAPQGLWTTPAGVVTSWSCNSVCIKYWLDQDSWPNDETRKRAQLAQDAVQEHGGKLAVANAAAQSLSAFDSCASASDVRTLEFLTKVATAELPWRAMIAIHSAGKAFLALLPYLLSLMSGTIVGATVAKVVMPYSRIPALVLTCAISYSLPYIMLLAIMFKTLFGDNSLLPAAFFGICTLLVFMPWQAMLSIKIKGTRDITEPQEHVEAEAALGLRLKIHYFNLVLFIVFFGVWISRWATFLEDLARSQLLGLEAESVRELLVSKEFWRKYGVRVAASIANYFGFSKIAGVVFADTVLWAVVLVDEANVDSKQALHQEEQELALFAELHRGLLLRPPKVAAQFDRIYREKQQQKEQRRKERLQAQLNNELHHRRKGGRFGRLVHARRDGGGGPPKPKTTE